MKRAMVGALLTVMAALSLHDLVGMAQGIMTPPGRYIPVSQWKKMLDADKPALGVVAGQAARIVDPFVIRRRLDGPNNASVHTKQGDGQDVTEVYYILEGSGTYTTGGQCRIRRIARPASRGARRTTSRLETSSSFRRAPLTGSAGSTVKSRTSRLDSRAMY